MTAARPLFACATAFEHRSVARALGRDFPCAILGIGPVLAGAEAALAIAQDVPSALVLFGLAGSYDLDRAPLGSLHEVAAVRLAGVGVGQEAPHHQPIDALPWPRLAADPRAADEIHLGDPRSGPIALTVCTSSAHAAEAKARQRSAPAPWLEEMEGFAVAWVCARRALPFVHLRAVSNAAGERDHAKWHFEAAFAALAEGLRRYLPPGERR